MGFARASPIFASSLPHSSACCAGLCHRYSNNLCETPLGIAVITPKITKLRKFLKGRKAKTFGMFLVERRNFSRLVEVRIKLPFQLGKWLNAFPSCTHEACFTPSLDSSIPVIR